VVGGAFDRGFNGMAFFIIPLPVNCGFEMVLIQGSDVEIPEKEHLCVEEKHEFVEPVHEKILWPISFDGYLVGHGFPNFLPICNNVKESLTSMSKQFREIFSEYLNPQISCVVDEFVFLHKTVEIAKTVRERLSRKHENGKTRKRDFVSSRPSRKAGLETQPPPPVREPQGYGEPGSYQRKAT
jgi:hypothetical protein